MEDVPDELLSLLRQLGPGTGADGWDTPPFPPVQNEDGSTVDEVRDGEEREEEEGAVPVSCF